MHVGSDLPALTNQHGRLDNSSMNISDQDVDTCDAASMNVPNHSIQRMRRTASDTPHHDVDVTDSSFKEIADDQICGFHRASPYASQEEVACLERASLCASPKDIHGANQAASKITLAAIRSDDCFATQYVMRTELHRSAERQLPAKSVLHPTQFIADLRGQTSNDPSQGNRVHHHVT
jgi:hypothetical protein